MAQTPPSAGRPGRQLIVLGLVFVILLLMMFFSGTSGMSWAERMEPRLGIDLVGGTRVTLLATTEQGDPAPDALEQAREIIENRVNALGVEEAEVITEGENRIVVSVAGEPESALNSVGRPAELRFRKVLEQVQNQPVIPTAPPTPAPSATPNPSATPAPTGSPAPAATSEPSPTPSGDGGQGGEAQAQTPTPTPAPTGEASPSPTPPASPSASPSPATDPSDVAEYGTVEERQLAVREKISDEAMAAALRAVDPATAEDPELDQAALLEAIRPFGELTGPEVAVLPAKLQFSLPVITCEQLNSRPAGSVTDQNQLVVVCDDLGAFKYLLDSAKVLGTDIDDANAAIPPGTNRWEVNLSFTGDGQPRWTDLTREATQNDTASPFDQTLLGMNIVTDEETGEWRFDPAAPANLYQAEPGADGQPVTVACGAQAVGDQGNCLVAAVLDNTAVSVAQIIDVQPGDSRITGDFSSTEAQQLASQLRFGALPLTFEAQEGQSITATLGVEYLRAGLLAAAIGFGLVLLYSFFYYRLLGIVIFGSLILSAVLTYVALVVLGRGIGFTLTLAGISGFIVAVGIAADSFVIYFERLKDEIREGRTPRSAVPRAWVRARRTIITANAVTLLAAVVLYLLSAGQVRGFAFALGLSTILDLLIVFTFRHPIMVMLARTRAFLSPTVSGLGRALELDRARGIRPAPAREVEA